MRCCKFPFERLNIEWDGSVTFCGSNFLLGNIYNDSFEDLWYGEKAVEFRKSVFEGSCKHCNLKFCFEYNDWNMKDFDEKFIKNPSYPKIVNLSYVKTCNLRCRTCRDDLCIETKKDTANYNKITDKVVDICKKAEFIYLDGSGEVFVSNHLKNIVKKISELNSNIEFFIQTNGLLCDEKNIKDFFGEDIKVKYIDVSINAGTKRTYKKITRGGNWKKLQNNLKYLSELKTQGKIKSLSLSFVFHSLNFKEMPKAVEIAQKYGIDVHFSMFRNWNSSLMCKNYEKYACWEVAHKDYRKFLNILRKLKKMKNYRFDEEFFRYVQSKLKDTWWLRLKSKILGEK